MLVQNLGSSDIPSHEILSDPTQLRSLAQLHESLDWFAKAVLKFARGLPTSASPGTAALSVVPPLPETTLNTLIALAKEFEELADICLLVLHLEVRVHCFYYLLPLWRGPGGGPQQFSGGPDSTDPSQEIIHLNKVLDTQHKYTGTKVFFSGSAGCRGCPRLLSSAEKNSVRFRGRLKPCVGNFDQFGGHHKENQQ